MAKQYEVCEHAKLMQVEASEEEAQMRFVEQAECGKAPWAMPRTMLAVAGAAALLVGGCATGVSLMGRSGEQFSARELLESPEMIDATAGNLVRFDTQHDPDEIRSYVASGLKTITHKMSFDNPEAFRQLEALQLSKEQKAGVVRMVTHLSDERVQDLGYEVYKTMHEDKSKSREELKQELLKKFGHRANELRQLRDEIVPEALRDLASSQGDATLDLERTRLFENFEEKHENELHIQSRRLTGHHAHGTTSHAHHTAGGMMTPKKAANMEMKIEDAAGIIGALLEQARIALDAAAYIGPAFGKKQPVNWMARSAVGGADFVVETGDCIMRQNDGGKEYNSVKVAMCPMKYAGALMDLLSGVNNAMGIQNANLPMEMNAMMHGNLKQNPAYASTMAAAQQNPNMAKNFLSNMMQQHADVHQGANFLSNKLAQHAQGQQSGSWLANMMKAPPAQNAQPAAQPAPAVAQHGVAYANPQLAQQAANHQGAFAYTGAAHH